MTAYQFGFTLCSVLAVPLWLAMIVAPKWSVTRKVMESLWPVFLLAVPYTLMEIPNYWSNLPLFLRPQLPAIAHLLSRENDVAIAWVHFVAVDFVAGRWIYLDSQQRGVRPWAMAPVLFVCLMFCPAGIVLYLGVRALTKPALPSNPLPN